MIKAIKVTIIFLLTFLLIKVHANESEKVESASKDPLTEWNELRELRNFRPFFSLKECSFTIFPFMELHLNRPVEEFAKIFGPYDRKVPLVNDIYVWDEYGISAYSKRDKAIITSIEFHFSKPEQRFSDEEEMRFAFNTGDINRIEIAENILLAKPRKLFAGDFLLGILFMDEYFEMHKANAALREIYKPLADSKIKAIYNDFYPNTSKNYFVKNNGGHDYIYDQPCPKDNVVTRLRIQPLNKNSEKVQLISVSSFDGDSQTEENYKASTTKNFQKLFNNDLARWNRIRKKHGGPLFSLQQCKLEYQGKPLPFEGLMEKWIDILGPYDSKKEGRSLDAYIWNRLGIKAYTGQGKNAVEGIGFYFNRSEKNPDSIEPDKLFTSGLLLNGLLLDGNFELDGANKALAQYYRDIANDKNPDINEVYFDSNQGGADIYYAHACIGSEQKMFLGLLMSKEKPNKIWQINVIIKEYN